jgi:hypothetical protein
MGTSTQPPDVTGIEILSRLISDTKRAGEKTISHFNEGGSILLSNFLGARVRAADEVTFSLAVDSTGPGTEMYVRKTSFSGRSSNL